MRGVSFLTAFACAAMLAACSGSKATGGAQIDPDDATVANFTGDWEVSGHIVGPWFVGPGFSPEPDPEILEKALTLTETASTGAAALTCATAETAVEVVPAAGIFEGKIPDPYIAKASLGISQDEVALLKQTCTANGATVQIYHLVAQDRLLLGLNDIVYQFDRKVAETAKPE